MSASARFAIADSIDSVTWARGSYVVMSRSPMTVSSRGRRLRRPGLSFIRSADEPCQQQPPDDEHGIDPRKSPWLQREPCRAREYEDGREHVSCADEERVDSLLPAELLLVRARQEKHVADRVVQRIIGGVL